MLIGVIPALNEQETIGEVVTGLKEYADAVIVVDDGSSDSTAKCAKSAGAIVQIHEQTEGYDQSIQDGLAQALEVGGTTIVTFDADGQHQPEDIMRMEATMEDRGLDIVVGARGRLTRVSERLFGLYSRLAIGIDDPLCGLKMYRSSVYHAIGRFDVHRTIGTHFVFAASFRGYSVGQVDIETVRREDQSRFGRRIVAETKILRAFIFRLFEDLKFKLHAR